MFNWFQRSSKSAPAPRTGTERRSAGVRTPAGSSHSRLTPADDPAAIARLPAWARQLGPDAQRIVAILPASVTLARSCTGYPRAVEKLLVHWSTPNNFRLAHDDMLMDNRGGRQGFPFEVVLELSALREYYDLHVAPVSSNAWGSTVIR